MFASLQYIYICFTERPSDLICALILKNRNLCNHDIYRFFFHFKDKLFHIFKMHANTMELQFGVKQQKGAPPFSRDKVVPSK